MNKDLTEGRPETVLWRFCVPLFGSIIFQQLYNIADSLVAGKFIGENALASVGNSYEVTLIFTSFAFGCNIGCSVIVSQLFGARDYGKMKTAVSTACISSAILCVILMIAGNLGCEKLLLLINTPPEAFADSELYLHIYIRGLPFVFFYNISTGIFSALGDSRTPFLFLAASSTANVGVDVLFVTVFDMGVAGLAWATLFCQGISCILSVTVVLLRLNKFEVQEVYVMFSFPLLKKLALIAVPSILQQSFVSVGNIVIQGVINSFGTSVMAGYSAAVKLNNLVITSFTSLGNGISNYTAQNIGAQRFSRIQPGFRAGLKLVWSLSVPLSLLYFFGGGWLLSLFLDSSAETAIETGILFLRILSPFYFAISVKLVADGILQGTGMMWQFMTVTFADLILRVILAMTLARTALGSAGIWCAWPMGWSVALALSLAFYRRGPWRGAGTNSQCS